MSYKSDWDQAFVKAFTLVYAFEKNHAKNPYGSKTDPMSLVAKECDEAAAAFGKVAESKNLKLITDATSDFKAARDKFVNTGLKFLKTTGMGGDPRAIPANHVVGGAFPIIRRSMDKYAMIMDAKVKACPPPRPASAAPMGRPNVAVAGKK